MLDDPQCEGNKEGADSAELSRLFTGEIPPSEDLAALADLVGPRGLGVDDWSGINMMCSDCSHGSPGSGHTHGPTKPGSHSLGLAGDEAALTDCLDQWIETSGSDLHLDRLELIW